MSSEVPLYDEVLTILRFLPYDDRRMLSDVRSVSKLWRKCAGDMPSWDKVFMCRNGCHMSTNCRPHPPKDHQASSREQLLPVTIQGWPIKDHALLQLVSSVSLHSLVHEEPIKLAMDLRASFNVTDVSIMEVAHCARLARLNLTSCTNITDNAVKEVAYHHSSELQKIKLDLCEKITDEAVKELARCSQLECLSLNGCTKIRGSSVCDVSRCCPSLRVLGLSRCGIDDEVVRRIIENSSGNLRKLDLSFNTAVTDESVKLLAARCSSLQHLNLAHCKGVTDDSVYELINCRELKMLNVCGCNKVGGFIVKELFLRCTGLRKVQLDHCDCDMSGSPVWVATGKFSCTIARRGAL